MVSSDCESGMQPARETRPKVVFMPVTPHSAAGMRTEPAVSEPNAANTVRDATDTAEPDDEPPVMWSVFQGLRASPRKAFWPVGP